MFDPLVWFRGDEPGPTSQGANDESYARRISTIDELSLTEAGLFCLGCLEAGEQEQIEELESVWSNS